MHCTLRGLSKGVYAISFLLVFFPASWGHGQSYASIKAGSQYIVPVASRSEVIIFSMGSDAGIDKNSNLT